MSPGSLFIVFLRSSHAELRPLRESSAVFCLFWPCDCGPLWGQSACLYLRTDTRVFKQTVSSRSPYFHQQRTPRKNDCAHTSARRSTGYTLCCLASVRVYKSHFRRAVVHHCLHGSMSKNMFVCRDPRSACRGFLICSKIALTLQHDGV